MPETQSQKQSQKQLVLGKIANQYGIDESKAPLLVHYHRQVRSGLNALFLAASTGDKLETRESGAVQGVSFFGRILGIFFPPAGAAVESVADVASTIKSHYDEKTLKNAKELLDSCGGIENLNQLTKTLATQLVGQYAQDLASLSHSKIKTIAKHDADAIESAIQKGDFQSLIDEGYSDAASLSGDEDLEKESSKTTMQAVQEKMLKAVSDHSILPSKIIERETQERDNYKSSHPVVGKFTKGAVEHHNHNTSEITH